jgi:hypothetical protein
VWVARHLATIHAVIDPELAPVLRQHPLVDFVEPPQVYRLAGERSAVAQSGNECPSPPSSTQECLTVAAQTVKAEAAHALGYYGAYAAVAMLDSGYDEQHEDLPELPSENCNGNFGLGSGCSDLSTSHGTGVFGVLTADGYNGRGVVGVAPGIYVHDLYVARVCDTNLKWVMS